MCFFFVGVLSKRERSICRACIQQMKTLDACCAELSMSLLWENSKVACFVCELSFWLIYVHWDCVDS